MTIKMKKWVEETGLTGAEYVKRLESALLMACDDIGVIGACYSKKEEELLREFNHYLYNENNKQYLEI